MIRIVNKYRHEPTPNDVYIGRGSPFGNPYAFKPGTKAEFIVATREEAIEKYREHFHRKRMNDVFMYEMLQIMFAAHVRGEDINLVCYCSPAPCHGQVIKEYLDERLSIIDKNLE
jgi:hypothetical protein